jgi:predicted AAA+ superfamily ATPase
MPIFHVTTMCNCILPPYKFSELHVVDTGIICAICRLTTNDWLVQADLFGHLIESYALQQIMTQLSWRGDDVQCYHFRDQKKHEVDFVLERGASVWGIEVNIFHLHQLQTHSQFLIAHYGMVSIEYISLKLANSL